MQLVYDTKRFADKAHALAVTPWLGSAGIPYQCIVGDRYLVITTYSALTQAPPESTETTL